MRPALHIAALLVVGCVLTAPGCAHPAPMLSGPDPSPHAAGPVTRYALGGPRR